MSEEPISGGEGEEIETQPELVPDPIVPRRIPNLGHALLFTGVAFVLILLVQVLLLLLGKSPVSAKDAGALVAHPKLQIASLGASYLATVAGGWFFFPMLWGRSFLEGMQWNWERARRQATRLIALGFCVSVMAMIADSFIPSQKALPIDEFFRRASDAWLVTLFGTLVAPVFEEICFRGFLFPAFAIAYDWLSFDRNPEGLRRWDTTTTLTPLGMVFSALLSSGLFALLHSPQVGHMGAALLVLFSVSLVLTYVRVKTESVAASAMVHGAYNSLVFLAALIQTGGYRHLERMTK